MISDYFIPGFIIKNLTESSDGGGSSTVNYSEVGTVSGRICPLNGNEIMRNERLDITTTHRFYSEYNVLINQSSKIVHPDGRTFNVKLIRDPMELHEFLQVDCELKN